MLSVLPLVVFLAASTACGDDDEERLSEEEYFAELTELDQDSDERGEELFGDEEPTAQEYADVVREAAQTYEEALNDLNPPEELQEEHDDLVAAIKAFGDALEGVEFDEGAPAQELFESEDFADEFAAVDAPFCALQVIADDKGIGADVGCEEEGEG